jgi:hypothetical protein
MKDSTTVFKSKEHFGVATGLKTEIKSTYKVCLLRVVNRVVKDF